MADDLEDFLRRAAQRRQAKAAATRQSARSQAPRPRPQYSNRKTERSVRHQDVDDLSAEDLIDHESDVASGHLREHHLEHADLTKLDDDQEATRKPNAQPSAGQSVPSKRRRGGSRQRAGAVTLTGIPVQDLVRLLCSPTGVQQAILMKEVLERPEHRW